jgi:2-polyprenyl-3-methyl-5-hydroxy-6-metoxy-1,4-benzoquinol methylase
MIGEYPVLRCDACHHRFAGIAPASDYVARVYDDRYFRGGQVCYEDYLSEEPSLRAHGQRYARLLERYISPGRLLDVGAAAGFILEGFRDFGWDCTGIEPNPTMSEHARVSLGLHVVTGTLEAFAPGGSFDAATMFHVLAHMVDPKAAIRKVRQLVRDGGYLLIEAWNVESGTARLFGTRWDEYRPPSTLHWFSPRLIRRLAETVGFRLVGHGRPVKYVQASSIRARLQQEVNTSVLRPVAPWISHLLRNRETIT